jgi:anti-sigma B factor antagonist
VREALRIDRPIIGGVAVVRPIGRFGPDPTFALREGVVAAIEEGARHVVLDLAGVSEIDAAGKAELIAAYVAAHKRRTALVLARLTPAVAATLRAGHLLSAVTAHATLEEALAAVTDTAP